MFLALREFKHAKLRYGLITGVIVMVAALVFILSGLANGLSSGNSEAIEAISADRFVLASGSEFLLDRSRLSNDQLEAVRNTDGVKEAEPLGASVANVRKNGDANVIGVSLIGVPPGTFLEPGVKSGSGLQDDADGVVIDQSLVNEGVAIGDTLTADPSGKELKVIGITQGRQYRLSPTMYVSLETWQSLQPEGNGGFNTIVVRGSTDQIDAIPDSVDGTMTGKPGEIVRALPGYVQMEGTLIMIQVFLVVIAAGVIAAFFFILTLQKMSELGVMKALGATTWDLAKALVFQVVFLSVIGIVVGIAIGCVMDILAEGVVPYQLRWVQMVVFGFVLMAVATIGTLLSLFRIARVDPLDAINKAV